MSVKTPPVSLYPTLSLIAACLGGSVAPLAAQNGLRDIPDPSVEAQLAGFKLPEGAKINLFAGDPAINKPVHMNWDSAGRLWVVGSSMYPHIKPGQDEEDKLYVLEDADGDGVAEKATVFADDLHIPSAVLPGDGGVYVVNSTEILFLQDADGDGKADRRTVMLSGFGTEDTHHLVHTLRWGPEGMMWFNQSIYIHSHVETPYGVRRMLGGGMWHFRPETRRLEPFMLGLVNSWGHVFDDWGQSFMTDGAGGQGINFVFPRSVFLSSPGASRILSGLNPGQPKHCGVEVLTGRHLPDDWQGTLAAPDFRGHRINRFRLSDNGSAYTSTQVDDLVSSTHRAFRPIDVKMGPDGAIYIADWYNPIIQHGEVDFRDPRRDHQHGRIWRITFEGRDLVKKPAIKDAPVPDLVALLDAPEGYSRQLAIAELRTRSADEALPAIEKAHAAATTDLGRLRALWASQAVNRTRHDWAAALTASESHKARAAALRAVYYEASTNAEALALAEKAVADPHPQVRLWGVSVLAQLDSPDTVKIALRALNGVAVDDFLDFAVWSICREHKSRWMPKLSEGNPFESTSQLLFAARAVNEPVGIPQVLDGLTKGEIASDEDMTDVADFLSRVGNAEQLDALFTHALADGRSPAHQAIVLKALAEAGRLRKLTPAGDPARLTRFLESGEAATFAQAASLAGQWKLEAARPVLEQAFVASADRDETRARAALDGLRTLGGGPTVAFLAKLAKDESASFKVRSLAVIGRTQMDPKAGAELALPVLKAAPGGRDPHGIFDAFLANKQGPIALATLLNQQPAGSLPQEIALLGVQKAGSAATKPEELVKALQQAGGLKPMKMALTPEEMERMMKLVAEKGDPHRGESIYRRAALQCVVCHAIGGAGGIIGPDLVSIGSSAPVDYLVESLLEPSKKIKEGYHTTLVTTKKGDNFAGAIAREDAKEIVVRDAAGVEHRVPKSEVASNLVSPVSLMPPGLTLQLREDEFVDLVRFLSELGKDGAFKTPANRYLRQWQALQPHERTRDEIGHYGEKIFAEDFAGYQWVPIYAKVNGDVPSGEMPQVVGRGQNRFGVARSFIEVSQAGKVPVKISGKLKDLHLYIGETKIALPAEGNEATVELDLKPGRHRLTAAGLLGYGYETVRVELTGDAGMARAVGP
ncbi:MAG: c-type cytochrome [Verrucomicrobiales bacterium]|nr:c-type cytochrome [Verrucomicrobiales bacterium]